MKRFLMAALLAAPLLGAPLSGFAGDIAPREGWVVKDSAKPYATLLEDLRAAIRDNKMGLVTEAGPTEAARKRGVEIPGNRVLGVYRNDFAVRALEASRAGMIEAPIRFYVTENPDGTATLSYKTPGFVFAPYADEGGAALAAVASELDAIFAAIAAQAVQ